MRSVSFVNCFIIDCQVDIHRGAVKHSNTLFKGSHTIVLNAKQWYYALTVRKTISLIPIRERSTPRTWVRLDHFHVKPLLQELCDVSFPMHLSGGDYQALSWFQFVSRRPRVILFHFSPQETLSTLLEKTQELLFWSEWSGTTNVSL